MIYEGLLGKKLYLDLSSISPISSIARSLPGWHYFGGCKPKMMIQTQCYQSHSSDVVTEQTQEGDESMMGRIVRQ